ncbi:MAG: UvrD-helicase domain-containing protein [Parachlamydiaceae bacterium]
MSHHPHRSAVLEASAGTGKTYTIEHLFANALIEPSPLVERPLLIKEILVVTFTKAAAAELKERIRANLLRQLEDPEKKRGIQNALADFDSASIFTIHGFCFRALQEQAFESSIPFSLKGEFQDEALFDLVEKVLRTEVNEELVTAKQMQTLLASYKNKPLDLIRDLVKLLKEGTPCAEVKNNRECWKAFCATLERLEGLSFSEFFKRYNKTKEWNNDLLKRLEAIVSEKTLSFADLMNMAPDVLSQLEYFLPSNIAKRGPGVHPMAEKLIEQWLPLFRELADSSFLLSRVLSRCQARLKEQMQKEGPLSFQGLVETMRQAVVEQPLFRKRLQDRYRLILIDEFQDTDPLQWEIFSTLFLNDQHHLVLVGDPKQSIYGFRGADIYTYLQASQKISEAGREELSTNYRSSPRLVHAMNAIFGFSKKWIPLPLTKDHLSYKPVQAGVTKAPLIPVTEPVASFLLAEAEEDLYPYYAEEVIRLHQERNIPLNEIAFIMRNHSEAKDLFDYLKSAGIPAELQKSVLLHESAAFDEIADLLQAFARPRDQSLIKKALCGRIMGYTPHAIAKLQDSSEYLDLLAKFIAIRDECRIRGGAALLFEAVEEAKPRLLLEDEGDNFLAQAYAIVEQLLAVETFSLEELYKEMQSWKNGSSDGKSALRGNGVPIITMHYSKGLEYLCVFAHGVSSRSPLDQGLVRLRSQTGQVLVPLFEEDPLYAQHIDETDAEKSRQLYVALTRAKEKLYIPHIQQKKKPGLGKASSLELFLARAVSDNHDQKALYETMSEGVYDRFFKEMATDSTIEVRKIEKRAIGSFHFRDKDVTLVEPSAIEFHHPALYQLSFSSLAKPTATPFHREASAAKEIPLGQETGILLHELLEKLPWDLVRKMKQPEDLKGFLDQKLKGTSYAEWSSSIAQMLFQTLSEKLPGVNIALKELEESHLFREMEFHYLSNHNVYKGVIDLVFMHDGNYYIVDWKSNWLPNYGMDELKEEMKRHDYYLQEEIYRKAVIKYADCFDDASSYGGAYYLFLRGNGVVWIQP